MEYIRQTTDIRINCPTVVSLGKFDGLHMGHKYLLEHMLGKQQEGLKAVMFTFDIPPRALVQQEKLNVLTTNEEKEAVFSATGLDYLIEYPFTEEVRRQEPEEFIRMLAERLCVKCVVAGNDFHFGHHRRGDYRTLQRAGAEYGFETIIVNKKKYEGREISSSFVREEIQKGNMERANMLLGYEYFVLSQVVHGKQLGRTLGLPTINQVPVPEKMLPPFGVYVSRVEIDGLCYGGITNVGRKPTIEGENPIGVETFIFDFSGDVYGKTAKVRFLSYLRPEQKFASIEELKAQMNRDAAKGREYLKTYELQPRSGASARQDAHYFMYRGA